MIEIDPIVLSIKLATITTIILLGIAIPLAWWMTHTHHRTAGIIAAVTTLPLVLPPSVLGFYMLLALGPSGPIGMVTQFLNLDTLAFTFPGLVIASVIYSLPFAVQPIQNAFAGIGKNSLEAAATLGASTLDRFISIALPLAKPGILTAAILTFAHTIGEFGVILMIGGNIAGETKVLSVAIYDHVESLEYRQAHILSLGLFVFAFVVLFLLQIVNKQPAKRTRSTPKSEVSHEYRGSSKSFS